MTRPGSRGPRIRTRGLYPALRDEHSTYAQARREWRRAQTDNVIRSLAYDYRRGLRDESTEDGFLEFQRRWPKLPPQAINNEWGPPLRCSQHLKGPRPALCLDCNGVPDAPQSPQNEAPPIDLDNASPAIRELLNGLRDDDIDLRDRAMLDQAAN